ncbi:MAG TPA: response regulator [Terricaulis sp.]|nr:response regulator [Terricaulis sp.]HRP10836.1 response regulator [Terricaulis sp.]
MISLNELHVLLVDDNAQMRFLLRCLLKAGGIVRISEAETAGDAFDILSTTPVGVVLVDWKMQPIDGLAFTRMLRWDAKSPNPYVPILMLTAHTEASRVTAARDAGVTGFIKKPISARVLFERMTNALTDTRDYVRTADFFGPDRRHAQSTLYAGPYRRAGDPARTPGFTDTIDIDDTRVA